MSKESILGKVGTAIWHGFEGEPFHPLEDRKKLSPRVARLIGFAHDQIAPILKNLQREFYEADTLDMAIVGYELIRTASHLKITKSEKDPKKAASMSAEVDEHVGRQIVNLHESMINITPENTTVIDYESYDQYHEAAQQAAQAAFRLRSLNVNSTAYSFTKHRDITYPILRMVEIRSVQPASV